MGAKQRVPLRVAAWLAVMAVTPVANAQNTPADELRRELQAMKKQLEDVQDKVRKQTELNKRQAEINKRQEDLIRKLTAERTASPPSHEPTQTAAAPPPGPASTPAAPASEKPREPWSPSQPLTLLSGARGYMNISFDALMDFGWSTTPDVTAIERGDHDPLQRGFTLPNEEIFLDGAVDPYFKGVADLVFKLDKDNATDVELEEVYLTTTALPWNLQAKAGQFFSEFGRINQQHPHAWDFVDQPLVIGRMFGPEGLRNPGARLSWLVPTPFYSELFLAAQNSQGDTAFSFRNTADSFFGRTPVDRPVGNLGDLLYVPRYVASFDLTDSQTIVAGLSGAFGPNASGADTRTQIYGGDLYWKWKPSWQSGGFPFVAWQSEVLGRRFEAGTVGGAAPLPSQTLDDWGFYSQLLYGFTHRWVAGTRVDWVSSNARGLPPADRLAGRVRWSPDLTFYPTEFSKIRLQYNYDHGQAIPNRNDSSVWLQAEFLLGSHAAHKF
jgi:hypothetical protein